MHLRRFPALAAALLLAACGSLGGLDDILGSRGQDDRSDISGEVTRIDTADRRIDLDVLTVNNLAERHSDSAIYYDDRTVVEYRGSTYEPTDLERGDEIRARGYQAGGRYLAETITVTRNVRADGDSPSDRDEDWREARDVSVRGTVYSIDSRDRTVELVLDPSYDEVRSDRTVFYDERTRVEFDGRTYRPESLERDDEVVVYGYRRDGRLWANDIRVLRDARSG
jgi:hypothetical protein